MIPPPRQVSQDRDNLVFFPGAQDSPPAPGKFLVREPDVPQAGQKALEALAQVQPLLQKRQPF